VPSADSITKALNFQYNINLSYRILLTAFDISEEFTNYGKAAWKEAGVDHKIDLKLAPALESLDKLIAEVRLTSHSTNHMIGKRRNLRYCLY
jgi:hypothetical protein